MSAKSFYFESKQSEESDDRSSVSSIPWNSDAIKQNQVLWENVERMLHFEEALPDSLEPELRQEILDWHKKFPQLSKTLKRASWTTAETNLNISSTNVSEILDLSSSLDGEDIDDDDDEDEQNFDAEFLAPPKPALPQDRYRFIGKTVAANGGTDARFELADVFGKDLHITPLTLRQRKSARLLEQRKSSTTSTQSDSPVPAKTIKYRNTQAEQFFTATANVESTTKSRYHMPPILNVLETKRRFCALNNNNNRSFVQLTQIHQAKSAAVHSTVRQALPERQYHHVWNKPLAAVTANSRFMNNRHAIVLPALQQQQHGTTRNSTHIGTVVAANRQLNNFSNSNSSVSSGDVRGRQRMHILHSSRQTTTTTSSGRSISAVPMHTHGAFYHL